MKCYNYFQSNAAVSPDTAVGHRFKRLIIWHWLAYYYYVLMCC